MTDWRLPLKDMAQVLDRHVHLVSEAATTPRIVYQEPMQMQGDIPHVLC